MEQLWIYQIPMVFGDLEDYMMYYMKPKKDNLQS